MIFNDFFNRINLKFENELNNLKFNITIPVLHPNILILIFKKKT